MIICSVDRAVHTCTAAIRTIEWPKSSRCVIFRITCDKVILNSNCDLELSKVSVDSRSSVNSGSNNFWAYQLLIKLFAIKDEATGTNEITTCSHEQD